MRSVFAWSSPWSDERTSKTNNDGEWSLRDWSTLNLVSEIFDFKEQLPLRPVGSVPVDKIDLWLSIVMLTTEGESRELRE